MKKHMYDTEFPSAVRPPWGVDEKDRRYKRFQKFHEKHGFWPEECWDLDYTIYTFTLPRLRFLKYNSVGNYPGAYRSWEEWEEVLDAIIWSLEQCVEKEAHGCPTDKFLKKHKMTREEYSRKLNEGLDLFGKNIFRLGW